MESSSKKKKSGGIKSEPPGVPVTQGMKSTVQAKPGGVTSEPPDQMGMRPPQKCGPKKKAASSSSSGLPDQPAQAGLCDVMSDIF